MERQSKFNVGKEADDRTCDGIVFDSSAEMKYYRDVICDGIACGEILSYERQKPYVLQEKFTRGGKTVSAITYKADFVVKYRDGHEQVIDIKGCPDNVAKIKRKLFWFKYPEIDYVWIGYSKVDGGWVTYEEIQAGRRERKTQKRKLKEKKENGKHEKRV